MVKGLKSLRSLNRARYGCLVIGVFVICSIVEILYGKYVYKGRFYKIIVVF